MRFLAKRQVNHETFLFFCSVKVLFCCSLTLQSIILISFTVVANLLLVHAETPLRKSLSSSWRRCFTTIPYHHILYWLESSGRSIASASFLNLGVCSNGIYKINITLRCLSTHFIFPNLSITDLHCRSKPGESSVVHCHRCRFLSLLHPWCPITLQVGPSSKFIEIKNHFNNLNSPFTARSGYIRSIFVWI